MKIFVFRAGALILGAQNGLYAQEPDSVLVVKKDGKDMLRLNSDGGFALYNGSGGWHNTSDVNIKENFEVLDGEDVLLTGGGVSR